MKTSLLVFLTVVALSGSLAERLLICYWNAGAINRAGAGSFAVEDINPKLCNTIIYSFFDVTDEGNLRMFDSSVDIGLGYIKKAAALKQEHPHLKILVAVGGWTAGSANFSAVAADPGKRATFVNAVVEFITANGFDGLDMDWEYPAQRGGVPTDKETFVLLLKELREAFDPHGWTLSAAVGASKSAADLSYDIPGVSKYVHYVHLMTYDLGGPWDSVTTFNSPLKGAKNGLHCSSAVNLWLKSGCPAEKLILGIPLYGHAFTLTNSSQNAPGSPASGAGLAGPYTQEAGVLSYQEICLIIGNYTVGWDAVAEVPYASNGNQWISYDDVKSVSKKVAYAKSKRLGGVMVWSIENDDFNGLCGTRYPLLSAIKKKLHQ